MKNVSVRLTDEYIERLSTMPGDSVSDKVRAMLDGASVPSPDLVQELSEHALVSGVSAPHSDAMEKLEFFMSASTVGIRVDADRISGAGIGNLISAAISKTKRATDSASATGPSSMFVDPAILAMMMLSEFYALEGDVWNALTVPLEVGFQDFDFISKDKGARTAVRAHFEDQLQMHDRLASIFLNRQVYGGALVVEAGDDIPEDIILPNPKHVAIGQVNALGPVQYGYVPQNKAEFDALYKDVPSFFYQPTTTAWNEKIAPLASFPFDPARTTYFHTLKYDHALYGIPSLARAARALDTRRYLEEMARATIEGIRNQLWVVTLDNPMAGEVPALSRQLSANRSSRTGLLVWRGGLNVNQYVPGSIDQLLGMETYWEFTLRVYRQLGISIRFISGENPNRTGASDAETDVKIGLNRMVYGRKPFERYLQKIADRVVGVGKVAVRMKDIEMQVADRIKTYLAPLMDRGLPSVQTAMSIAGLQYDTEMAQHKSEEAERKLIFPYTAFAQAGPQSLTQHTDSGRPGGIIETSPRQEARAATDDILSDYVESISREWDNFVRGLNETADVDGKKRMAQAFILGLLALASIYREPAYRKGFVSNGGEGDVDYDRLMLVVSWDQINTERFEEEIIKRIEADQNVDGLRRRAMWYASQGYRVAFTTGMIDAKAQHGWGGWRRLLRPYASRTGPCQWCIDDSKIIHPITDIFTDHPNGVCGVTQLAFYNGRAVGPIVNVPRQLVDQEEAEIV